MAYDNNFKGVFFKNDKKETDQHPDYTGSAQVDGVEYFMDAWINTADSGRKYMSVKFKPKQKQSPAQKPAAKRPNAGFDGMPDDAPF